MRSDPVSKLLDLGTLRLERAVKRLHEQDHEGAMEDLRTALRHMREAGADPLSVQHLAAVIKAAERKVGCEPFPDKTAPANLPPYGSHQPLLPQKCQHHCS